jgi:hypothetical protein
MEERSGWGMRGAIVSTKAGAPSIPLGRPSFLGHYGSTLVFPEVLSGLEELLGNED